MPPPTSSSEYDSPHLFFHSSLVCILPTRRELAIYYNMASTATIGTFSNRSSPATEEPLARTEHIKFTPTQIEYLKGRLPEYHALCKRLRSHGTGPRGLKNVKGERKAWVYSNICPAFVSEFNCNEPGGPNLDSLRKVCCFTFFKNCLLNYKNNCSKSTPGSTITAMLNRI